MNSRILLLVGSVILAGCTTNMPVPEGYKGALAVIHDSVKPQDKTLAYFFELTKVDGRPVTSSTMSTRENNYGQGFHLSSTINERQVPAIDSTLSIQALSYYAAPILALGGENYEVRGDVKVSLKPNQHYYVKGDLSKNYSAVWLEDSNGKIVSEKIQKGVAPTTKIEESRKTNAAKAELYLFNTASVMHKIDGTDSITITLDDKRVGAVAAGQYVKVDTTVGNHRVTL